MIDDREYRLLGEKLVSVPLRGNVNNDYQIETENATYHRSFRPLTGKCK